MEVGFESFICKDGRLRSRTLDGFLDKLVFEDAGSASSDLVDMQFTLLNIS